MKYYGLIAFFVLLGVFLSYTDINLAKRVNTQLFLNSYDYGVFQNQSACFGYALETNVQEIYPMDAKLEVNGKELSKYEVEIGRNGSFGDRVCVPPDKLAEGKNRIVFSIGGLNVFFSAIKSEKPGEKASFAAVEQPGEKKKEPPNPVPMVFASFLMLLPGFLLAHRFFRPRDVAESFALTFSFSILLTVIAAWLLNFSGLLGGQSLAAAIVIFCSLLFVKGKFHFPEGSRAMLGIISVFVLFSILVQFLLPSHDSIWSVYYDRQAQAVYESGGIPQEDGLSYLGRPFSFVPGYMLLRSSFSWLSGADIQQSFFVFQVLGNAFFVSSALFLSRKLGLKAKPGIVLLMFLYSSVFIFGWAIVSILHLYAFSLFLTALALALDKNSVSGVFAGLSGIFHASFLFGFPFVLLVLQKRAELKPVAKYSAIAALLFLALYSYVLAGLGSPTEIQKENWGYLIKGGVIDLGTNTAGFMSLAVLPALAYGFGRHKKLALSVVLLILVFLLVSYRVNVFLSLLAAVLFVRVFGSREMIALSLLFTASLWLNLQTYQGLVGSEVQSPFDFINKYAPSDSNVLVEPLYGHTAAYFGKRKVLSDLYVEYADDEKYLDTVGFVATGDMSLLEKWNISYTATLKTMRVVAVNKYIYPRKEIVYPGLDKIYDNGLFNIHYRRV